MANATATIKVAVSHPAAMVREFHEFFNQPVRRKLTRLPQDEVDFRLNLIAEEHDELAAEFEHWEEYDPQKVYKELADLVYVIYGLDAFMGGYLDQAVMAVHESNMTKLWDCERCGKTGYIWDGESYSEDAGGRLEEECPQCGGEGKYAKYREDGKVLKPPTYTPADLSFIKEEPQDA